MRLDGLGRVGVCLGRGVVDLVGREARVVGAVFGLKGGGGGI